MNNQAAQTMPELPGPFDVIEQVDKYNFVHNVEVYTADQMHQYARDYAAALSQNAGVAEGFVMVPIVPTEAMKSAGAACFPNRWGNGDETDGEDAADCYRAMIAAAPAASGGEDDRSGWCRSDGCVHKKFGEPTWKEGDNPFQSSPHPDALPDGTLSKSTAKRLAAASVSERARELLAAECGVSPEMVDEYKDRDVIVRLALRAIEQALTQQRGEPNGKLVGWWNGIMPDVTERSPYGPSVRWGADAENSGHDIPLYDGYNPIHYTTPQPSADAVRELVRRWRDDSVRQHEQHRRQTGYEVDFSYQARSDTLDTCADELDALIKAAPKGGSLHE